MSNKKQIETAKVIIDGKVQDLTPEIAATFFARSGSDEQARFFNAVADASTDFWFELQVEYISSEECLTLAGRRIMQSLAERSHNGIAYRYVTGVQK